MMASSRKYLAALRFPRRLGNLASLVPVLVMEEPRREPGKCSIAARSGNPVSASWGKSLQSWEDRRAYSYSHDGSVSAIGGNGRRMGFKERGALLSVGR